MKLARYLGGGQVFIADEPKPECPPGGLLVRTEACGLCSGELMDWYMDKKIPHVFGHEVAGIVEESQDERFPVGSRVFPHHHAPCLRCEYCLSNRFVHCAQWKRTKLVPGGMAEFFAVSPENLTDTHRVDELCAIDAALIEPLACVVKSIGNRTRPQSAERSAVIGLGVMGLMHALSLPGCTAYEINPLRAEYARSLGIRVLNPDEAEPAEFVYVCPGTKPALDLSVRMVEPNGTITLFAPMPPGQETPVDLNRLYFLDARIEFAYSCGPIDTIKAIKLLREKRVQAEQVVSDFVGIDGLPQAYLAMKRGEILKAMVIF